MKDKGKKIFLAASIVVPFLLYCGYYYGMMIKNAPYKFSEFETITLNYGTGDTLLNQFDSKSQHFQYVDESGSVVRGRLKLTKDDLLYLHRKAADYGFWDFPSDMRVENRTPNSPRYHIKFQYQRKTKEVYFDLDYNGNPKLKDAVRLLIETINKKLDEAASRTETK